MSSSDVIESTPTTRMAPSRWPWLVLGGFIAMAAVAIPLVKLNGESVGQQIPYVIAFAMFGAVGAFIVSRDARNTIGLLFMGASFLTALSFLSGEIFTRAVVNGQTGWWLVVLGLFNNYGWLFGILPTIFLLPLLFPDGRLPSPRWRPFLWFVVVFLVSIGIELTVGQRTLTGSGDATIANPLYVDAVGSLPTLDPVIALSLPVIFGASIASLILRFRRSASVERQQIKWVVFGLLVALVGIVATSFSSGDTIVSALIQGSAFLLFPVSVGVAVLRFHLYDLDVVIRKAILYAALAAFIGLVYAAIVGGVGAMIGSHSSTTLSFAAAATLAVLFQPAREGARRVADRLVYGNRATPYEVLTTFSERVSGTYDAEDVLARMASVLGEGTGAERARVWLRVGDELRPVATHPADAPAAGVVVIADERLPEIVGEDATEVRHQGELLGALSVAMPASEPMTPAKGKLVEDLAGQAGLVLRNVRLLEELRASRRRIVSAQDERARVLERNIHDGAQQQLVALAVKLRLAEQLVQRDPEKSRELLTQLQGDATDALENLRDLARGIYPPLLADKGLASALEAQARKAAVPTTLEVSSTFGRFGEEVEATVYFSALEALNNVAKYAAASSAVVSLEQTNGDLTFEVRDDGRGFDPGNIGYGTGLQGMADRLAAIGGTLEIRSAPGAGTAVSGRIRLEGS